ncbi:MAG: Ribosomal protein S12 methylthiotransferase RimO [Firmicutes bacterium ADurb.Bin419]|nr:MAG: Ribosomal protein S12 methylthiotransferase RimO [Firmicutes bacterium ADurb.Bin419]
MKILLIWPPSPEYCVLTEEFSCCEPLGLEYIAASVSNEHHVEIIDMRFDRNLVEILKTTKPDIVGVSIPFTVVVNVCNDLLKTIKGFNPDIKVIIGGHHPSVGLKHIDIKYVDYVIAGEGVKSFRKLVNAIENNEKVDDIDGIGFKDNDSIVYTREYHIDILDDYPLPARNLTEKYRLGYFHAHYKPVALMRFSYGCPYNCSFCVLWKLCKRKYISRKNSHIIEELLQVSSENVYVVDDEAFINTDKMDNLADEISRNGIKKKYHMYVRSDTIVNNPQLFDKWASVGLDSVLIGMESVFEEELIQYNKGISANTSFEAMKILKANGIEVRANFIIQPDYTKQKFEAVKRAIEELDIDRPTFAVLTPMYGTDFYEASKDKFITNNPEFFDCYHTFLPTRLPLKEFYSEFTNLFRFANSRKKNEDEQKVFYAGKSDNSFEEMLKKIENSYLYYK